MTSLAAAAVAGVTTQPDPWCGPPLRIATWQEKALHYVSDFASFDVLVPTWIIEKALGEGRLSQPVLDAERDAYVFRWMPSGVVSGEVINRKDDQ